MFASTSNTMDGHASDSATLTSVQTVDAAVSALCLPLTSDGRVEAGEGGELLAIDDRLRDRRRVYIRKMDDRSDARRGDELAVAMVSIVAAARGEGSADGCCYYCCWAGEKMGRDRRWRARLSSGLWRRDRAMLATVNTIWEESIPGSETEVCAYRFSALCVGIVGVEVLKKKKSIPWPAPSRYDCPEPRWPGRNTPRQSASLAGCRHAFDDTPTCIVADMRLCECAPICEPRYIYTRKHAHTIVTMARIYLRTGFPNKLLGHPVEQCVHLIP